jgi:predicted RNA-binding Zn ribbon-like protein
MTEPMHSLLHLISCNRHTVCMAVTDDEMRHIVVGCAKFVFFGVPMTDYLFLGNEPTLDFVNTEIVERGKRLDLLQNFEDLAAWFCKAGLAPSSDLRLLAAHGKDAKENDAAMQQARELRRTVRRSLEKIVETGQSPAALADFLQNLLREPRLTMDVRLAKSRIQTQTESRLEEPRDLTVAIARNAANFLARADYSAIRKCEGSGCILFFYDTSKNHTRRWCSMDLCGNRAKVAAFRQRN